MANRLREIDLRSAGLQKKLYLGNLDAKRDWGYAGDYVDAMWRMLQLDSPEDFVIATGETHAVSEFLDEAFGYAGLDWREFVEIDTRYNRPTEVDLRALHHAVGAAARQHRVPSQRGAGRAAPARSATTADRRSGCLRFTAWWSAPSDSASARAGFGSASPAASVRPAHRRYRSGTVRTRHRRVQRLTAPP